MLGDTPLVVAGKMRRKLLAAWEVVLLSQLALLAALSSGADAQFVGPSWTSQFSEEQGLSDVRSDLIQGVGSIRASD